MKLSDVVKLWDEMHKKDTGDLMFCDFADIVEKILGLENDLLTACIKE